MPLKPRYSTTQDRARRMALKEALRSLHKGPYATPRKVVVEALGIWDSTYSKWLNDEHPDLPGVTDLMVIISVCSNPAPLQAMASYSGEGYLVVESHEQADEPGTTHGVRLVSLQTDMAVDVELAKALEDETLDPQEAARVLPLLEAQAEVNRRHTELVKRVLKTGQAAGGLQ